MEQGCKKSLIYGINKFIDDLNQGVIIQYEGPDRYSSSSLGDEVSKEVARLLEKAVCITIDPALIEHVAKALCAASNEQWREGMYPQFTGTDQSGNTMIWEEHDSDKLNNHWRYKAEKVIRAIMEFED